MAKTAIRNERNLFMVSYFLVILSTSSMASNCSVDGSSAKGFLFTCGLGHTEQSKPTSVIECLAFIRDIIRKTYIRKRT
jgi:hypothetical protein